MADSVPNGFQLVTAPITSTTPGEVIQNLVIDVSGDQPAIDVTSPNVTIKNVLIHTTTGDGIDVWNNNASISNVEVDGPTPTDNSGSKSGGSAGIYAYNVTGLKVDHATFRDVGTGISTDKAPGTAVSNIEGHDMQGPFPGGQLVQFGGSDGSSLTNFYLDNDAKLSHPEDDISVYNSRNVSVSNGVLDGDNSPSGVGVMVEGTSNGTKVSGVDALHMGDGAFSAYSDDVAFDDVHAFSNITGDQGRGAPLSGGLIFYAAGSGDSFTDATYTDPGNANNVFSGDSGARKSISADPGEAVAGHITNTFAWSDGATAGAAAQPGAGSSSPTSTGSGGGSSSAFVYNAGFSDHTLHHFIVGGDHHSVLSLPSSDFSSVAAVLHDTHTVQGSAVITDPTTHNTLTISGVTRSELKAHAGDITLHA